VCKGTKYLIKFFNLIGGNFEFAANCKDLRHFQRVKKMQLLYHVLGKTRGLEPPVLPAIPPQAASAEPGTHAITLKISKAYG
jgi:hypothetical protein